MENLAAIAAEIEHYVGAAGWDRPPVLFALVPTRVLAADPSAAAVLPSAHAEVAADALTPIAQDDLPDGPLDEVLASIGWPDEVVGCALSQEIVMLPPDAESSLDDLSADSALAAATTHPDRREARLVVAVLRDGSNAALLRVRSTDLEPDDLLTGDNLAPNLVDALVATLRD